LSERIRAVWRPSPDAYGPRKHRRPCAYEAYVPDPLSSLPRELSSDLAADVVDVESALARFDGQTRARHDLERLARFLLRAEAVASSKIEGLRVNTRRLARHEAMAAAGITDRDETAEAVLGNVTAMKLAVDRVATLPSVTRTHIAQIHAELMRHSGQSGSAGQVRTEQNWIGGNDFNPCQAAFVPPPATRVRALLDELCSFVNRDDLPSTVQAALVHAQFETIHPFADGNGRTGRALIHVVLRRRGLATGFIPPISLVLATRAGAYINGLTRFRYDGPPASPNAREGVREWLGVFLHATRRATDEAEALCARMAELEERWRAALHPRRNSAADRLLPHLIANPVIGVGDVMRLTGASRAAAFNAIAQCAEARVIRPLGNRARNRLFEAREVFVVLTDYERALATHSGDTRAEPPRRPVPHRRKANR
jgi:Fic family protein